MLGHNIQAMLEDGVTLQEAVRCASLSMLNELQDIITVMLTVPWPQALNVDRLEFAEPHVELRDGELHIWFGETDVPQGPVVRVPIPPENGVASVDS